jgi:hypothetical protein
MTVKVDQSVTQDDDARGAMYCSVLNIIHNAMVTRTLSSLSGIKSTEVVDREGSYACDLGGLGINSNTGDSIKGSSGDDEDGGIPIGVTTSFVVAGGMIAFTALFVYRRRKQHRRSPGGSSSNSMDMDTTIVDGGATSIDIMETVPASPVSAYSCSSLYITESHINDTLQMSNAEENWADISLMASNSEDYGVFRYESV